MRRHLFTISIGVLLSSLGPGFSSSVLAQTTAKPAVAPAASNPGPSKPASKSGDDGSAVRVLLAPALETALLSPFSGRVVSVNVSLGQSFSRGKLLVSFDCEEQQARLRMADSDLAAARETYEAKLRLQGLQQAGEVEVSLAASAAERARAQLALYRAQLGQCSVVAPFSGRAVKISVKPHQGVTQGQPLLELVSDGALKLRLNAPAKWISWLKPGTPFEVLIEETGRTYRARVTALNGRVDAVSQSIELEATIADKAPDLLPGMSGLARFTPPQ